MATKKQKRERGEQKRVSFLADVRKTGLEAQHKDREHREKKQRLEWKDQHDKKHHKFVDECPLCQDLKKQRTNIKETI